MNIEDNYYSEQEYYWLKKEEVKERDLDEDDKKEILVKFI